MTFCSSETPGSFFVSFSHIFCESFLIMFVWRQTFLLSTAQGRNLSGVSYICPNWESGFSHIQTLSVSLQMVAFQIEHGDSHLFREHEIPGLSVYWFISCNFMQSVCLLKAVSVPGWYPRLIIKEAIFLLNKNHLIGLNSEFRDLVFLICMTENRVWHSYGHMCNLQQAACLLKKWECFSKCYTHYNKVLINFLLKCIRIPLFFSFQEVLIKQSIVFKTAYENALHQYLNF